MPPNIEAMLRAAIDAVKANRKAEARLMLERIVQIDQMNEQAWLWLSACVETAEEQAICLENVLDINPNNQKAIKGLQALQTRLSPADDPFAASPFNSAPATDPFAGSPFGGAPQPPRSSGTPTSVDWGADSTSVPTHGSGGSVPAFSDADYDAWLSNLPLGTANSVFSAAPADSPFSAPADPLEDLDNFDYSALWAGDQRSTSAPSVDAEPFSFRKDYTSSSAGYADEGLFSSGEEATYSSSAAEGMSGQVFTDEPLIEDSQPDYSSYSSEPADERGFDSDEVDDSPLTLEDIQGYAEPTPALPARPRNVPQSLMGGKGRSTFSGSGRGRYSSLSDPFSRIPAEIEATVSAGGSLFSVGVLVLAGLNVIALVFLVVNLLS